MEKKIKYDFELKLKFLKVFICMWSCPSTTFPQKWILGVGGMTPTYTVY